VNLRTVTLATAAVMAALIGIDLYEAGRYVALLPLGGLTVWAVIGIWRAGEGT
jgi:hypothetical protein